MIEGSSYSLSDAAALLGVSVPTVRGLLARGTLVSFRTPGGHLRIPSESIAAYREGRPNRTNPAITPSVSVQNRRDNLEALRLESEELRVRRDLRKLQAEEREGENQRRAEAQATALSRKEEREARRVEKAREVEARRQREAEAEASHRRRQWGTRWTDYALNLVPKDAPRGLELDVHQAAADALTTLDPDQPERIVERIVRAAVDRALEPWKRRKEIEKIIQESVNNLPFAARGLFKPTEWEVRAHAAAADSVTQTGESSPLTKIREAVNAAVGRVADEYEAACAQENHRKTVQSVLASRPLLIELSAGEREDAESSVRDELAKLPVGTTRQQMERARDAALAAYVARNAALGVADRYLAHVGVYLEELSDPHPHTGEWDLGDIFERARLAEKLKQKLRPGLIRHLVAEPLDEDAAREFIEECVDRELGLDE